MTVMTEDPSEAIRRVENEIAFDYCVGKYIDEMALSRDRLFSKLVKAKCYESYKERLNVRNNV